MRIGIITGEYPPMDGGVGAYSQILAGEMSRRGHQVYVFTRQAASISANDLNVSVHGVVAYKWGWMSNVQISRWAAEVAPDVVIIQYQTAAYDMHPAIHWAPAALRRKSIPSIVTFHDLRVPYLFPKAGKLRRWVVNKLANDVDGVICTQSEDFAILKSNMKIRRLVRIPIGSNISPQTQSRTVRDLIRRGLSLSDNQLLIGYFGFVNRSKGVGILVDSLAHLVASGLDAHLLMVGGHSGEIDSQTYRDQSEVIEHIKHKYLEQRVHWTGFAAESEIGQLLKSCDIVALPFLDGVTLRSGTLMAALAAGTAIVTTSPKFEIPELEQAVEYAKPSDSLDLAKKIGAVWRDEAYRIELEQCAADASKLYFSWGDITSKTIAFCREISSLELAKHS